MRIVSYFWLACLLGGFEYYGQAWRDGNLEKRKSSLLYLIIFQYDFD